jgi:hypothetical protein
MNSETILSSQSHNGDSAVQTVIGDKYKGDGYYGRSDGFHTVQYNITGFVGTIDIQATLAVNPGDADWFTIYTQAYPVVNDEGTTGSFMSNFTGNYVWVRAYVNNWTDGTVNSIQLNH